MTGDAGCAAKRQPVYVIRQIQAARRFSRHKRRNVADPKRTRQEAKKFRFQHSIELSRREVARRGRAMQVQHLGVGAIDAGPAALPGAHAEIQILHIGRLVDFDRIRPARRVSRHRKACSRRCRRARSSDLRLPAARRSGPENRSARAAGHHGFAGFFAALALGKENLRGRGEQIRAPDRKRCAKGRKKSGLDQHVVVQHANMRDSGRAECPDSPRARTIAARGLSLDRLREGKSCTQQLRPSHRPIRYRPR